VKTMKTYPDTLRNLFLIVTLGIGTVTHAAIITTSNPGDIAAFESGATVQTFDNIAGVTAVPITDYTVMDLTGTTALINKDPAQSAFFNSGGASFNDPVGNPGVPIGIASPGGGIVGDKFSGNNVAGPVNTVPPPFTLFEPGSFMEVIFPTGVSKVGLYVSHGSLTLILKDENNSNLSTGDFTGTASSGEYLGITRTSADVRGVTILGQGAFTIDDFTYGNSTTGGTVPDNGSTLSLAIAAGVVIWLLKRPRSIRSSIV
jgi:hypothetical protein